MIELETDRSSHIALILMPEISNDHLFKLNQLGIIPGPDETSEDFLKRAEYCLNLKDLLSNSNQLPFNVSSEDTKELLENPCHTTQEFFDIAPTWVPVFFSNYRLTPWHGGCVWIFQMAESDPTGAFFQLRRALRTSSKYLGLYARDELIAHELAHVGRMVYQEPKFEEIFAYQTSQSAFRRWFGPIVQSSLESMIFVVVLFLILLIDLSLLINGYYAAFKMAMWLKVLPLLLLAFALGRLWWRQRRYFQCINHLKMGLGNEHKAKAVTYRLQDHEIEDFATMPFEDIKAYAQNQAQKSLRWRLIFFAYFS